MKALVTGVAGMIGSHLADRLIEDGDEVVGIDNLSVGFKKNVNPSVLFYRRDITNLPSGYLIGSGFDVVYHLAAIARTPWTIDDPSLTSMTNAHGTQQVLEMARQAKVKRVVMASSSVVYAAWTPYRASKEATEMWGRAYVETYGMSVISFRFSNVYGPRQSEEGPSPNVFAALRKCKREKGHLEITGDGEQSRSFTHVSDIVDGLVRGANSDWNGEMDLCTGVNHTLNQCAKYFECPIVYIPERQGDVKHIIQDGTLAKSVLAWEPKVKLEEGIRDVL